MTSNPSLAAIGHIAGSKPYLDPADLLVGTQDPRKPLWIVEDPTTGRRGVATGGELAPVNGRTIPALGCLPAVYPEWLGDRSFTEAHNLRFPYVAGAMANGIATVELVEAMASIGALGFFGAAGLDPTRVEAALDRLESTLGTRHSWGSNLIHSPNEPAIEAAVADLYIRRDVRRVSASAYMSLTKPIVRYAATGLRRDPSGRVHRKNFVFAKISRPEVARHFLSPPPAAILDALVGDGQLTREEAELARTLPVAEDVIVESDSGGHTDNRPLGSLFPTIVDVRDRCAREFGYTRPIRLGAAGGIGTPAAAASAFALGAAFVLTGSVNQGCVESGLDVTGKKMLAVAGLADVIMAPAADMFELGVEVQVLSRGTMFAVRAKRLYEYYRSYETLESIPDEARARLEKEILGTTCGEAWAATRDYWMGRDPAEVTRAEAAPKHKMALTFRAYLGQSSRWAIVGKADRRLDYQIWCGPAMGAFNAWAKDSFLEAPENRTATQVALNILEGAAVITRAQQLKSFGVPMPAAAFDFRPRPLS